MVKEVLKGVGKKLILQDDYFEVKKTLGKNVVILIKDIQMLSYENGTLKKNGVLTIKWNSQGSTKTEDIFFYYSSNEVVKGLVDEVNMYISLPEPKGELMLNNQDKVGLFKQLNSEAKADIQSNIDEKNRLKELDNQGTPYCPKCHSTSLSLNGKKLSLGRAIVGGALLGGTGAILGGLTSKKVELVCLNCGNKFKPGKK